MDDTSPASPSKQSGGSMPALLDFPDAMRAVIAGKRITRIDWADLDQYAFLDGGFLRIRPADHAFYNWTVTDGDMTAIDWMVI